MRNKKKLIIIIIGLLIAAALANHFLSTKPSVTSAAPAAGGPPGGMSIKVEAVKATTDSLTNKIDVVGNLISNESAVIASEIDGRVVAIPFKEGTQVKPGDLLFRLDDSVQKAQLAQAEANFSLAQNNVKRYSGLVTSGAISKVQLEQAQADLSLAAANIELARANEAKTTIRAPFSGIAGIRQVSIGGVVTKDQKLVNLEQMSPIRVQFSVPEKYLTYLKNGQNILISSEPYPDEKFEAKIFAIDPRIDENNRSVSIQALSPNKDGKLYPGQFISIILPLQASRNVVVIPDQALVPGGKATIVYTVVDGKAKANEVKVGARRDNQAEIISGIKEGDIVITAGQLKIQEGAPVRTVEPTPVQTRKQDEEDERKVLAE